MSAANVPPNRIARTLASHLWGQPDKCQKIATGTYEVRTPGHGGFLALLHEADLPGDFVDAAETAGLVETLGVVATRRCVFASTAEGHSRRAVCEWIRNRDRRIDTARFDVAVFEEDCDWAPLALVCPAVVELFAPHYSAEEMRSEARKVIGRNGHLAPFSYLCDGVTA